MVSLFGDEVMKTHPHFSFPAKGNPEGKGKENGWFLSGLWVSVNGLDPIKLSPNETRRTVLNHND